MAASTVVDNKAAASVSSSSSAKKYVEDKSKTSSTIEPSAKEEGVESASTAAVEATIEDTADETKQKRRDGVDPTTSLTVGPVISKTLTLPASLVGLLLSRRPVATFSGGGQHATPSSTSVMNRIQGATNTRISRTKPAPPKASKTETATVDAEVNVEVASKPRPSNRRRATKEDDDDDEEGSAEEHEDMSDDELSIEEENIAPQDTAIEPSIAEDTNPSPVVPATADPVEFQITGTAAGIEVAERYLTRMVEGERIKDVLSALMEAYPRGPPTTLGRPPRTGGRGRNSRRPATKRVDTSAPEGEAPSAGTGKIKKKKPKVTAKAPASASLA